MSLQPIELIKRAFPALNPAEMEHLAGLSRLVTYPENTILCREGEIEHIFYLISEGETVITKNIQEGESLILRHLGAGEFFGEMAIIQRAPRAASVTTTTETTVLEIHRDVIERTITENAPLAMAMVRTTINRLRDNDLNTISELREAYQNLEKLDKAKLDFIEVTAHELRTPLTVMRGYASILSMEPSLKANEMLQEVTRGVLNGTQRLHEIVNNMLDVQRIDMKSLPIARVPVSLPVVLRGVSMEFKQALKERNINLYMDLDAAKEAGVYIEADPGLVNKALYHVLMNAIKYTPDQGSITVTVEYEGDGEEQQAHIIVRDTGIGIDREHHERIFEKFYRLGDVALHSSGKTAYKAGGPGLGLAIALGVMNAHNGRIYVESSGVNEQALPGSAFHLIFPVKAKRATGRENVIKTS